ncbi:Protein of unknown function [Flavobacterium succinicans]|uniref:DUF2971 domain-containing protein n=1 Tax=Flavobacterium succinicans TaxID=29536 RepID=A0A1I4ZY11_9FLAO|nr:DUF2971 domain-containing protein [Flavobacterium succinicans]SFN55013.1 Protein of unknown function [Flavobacterium succinicans]
MKLDPRGVFLTFNLKWKIEKYIHEIGLNANYPQYVTTSLYHKGLKMSNPEFLYKFYAPENYNFESLENPYLYFGDPSDFNDTFDCVISENSYIEKFLDNKYLENIGICNFSIEKTNQMWAYYAEKNKGFAVKFKNNKLFLPYGDNIAIKSHVLYLNNDIPDHPNLIETLKSLEDKHAPDPVKGWQHQVLFHHDLCRKNTSYTWESEYRFITFNREEIKRQMTLNPTTIDSIYIGHKMSKDNLERLKSIVINFSHVKVFLSVPNPKSQKLEDIKIKDLNRLVYDQNRIKLI